VPSTKPSSLVPAAHQAQPLFLAPPDKASSNPALKDREHCGGGGSHQ